MAIWQRQPTAGLIVHSEQEQHYASRAYRHLIRYMALQVAEILFGCLKKEWVHWRNYPT